MQQGSCEKLSLCAMHGQVYSSKEPCSERERGVERKPAIGRFRLCGGFSIGAVVFESLLPPVLELGPVE